MTLQRPYDSATSHFVLPKPGQEFKLSPFVKHYPEDILYCADLLHPYLIPYEFTGWRDEQLSWKEGAYIHSGLSGSPEEYWQGRDCRRFFEKYCVNSFERFPIGTSKHVVTCSERGNVTCHGVMLRTGEYEYQTCNMFPMVEAFRKEGTPYDMTMKQTVYERFIFQIAGPRSLEILETVTGEDLHDIKFIHFRDSHINGTKVRVARYGMAGSLAYEVHGPAAEAPQLYDVIYQAGKSFGMRRLGWRAYMMNHTENGFPNLYYHFVCDTDLQGNDRVHNRGSAGQLRQTFLRTPYDLNWGFMVKFDHDFIGRAALQKIAAAPPRKTVTLEWNAEDIAELVKNQFDGGGEHYRDFDTVNDMIFFDMNGFNVFHDTVLALDGREVGISSGRCYSFYFRRMISQCVIDRDQAVEGTEVTILWGPRGAQQKRVRARVARYPYWQGYDNRTIDLEQIPRIHAK